MRRSRDPRICRRRRFRWAGPSSARRARFRWWSRIPLVHDTESQRRHPVGRGVAGAQHQDTCGQRDRPGLVDYALTKDQTVRLAFNTNHNATDNLGVGSFDQPERAYSTTNRISNLRLQETGPIARRFFINNRLAVTWSHNDQQSALEAPTIQVLDAVTSGGGQMSGARRFTSILLASDLDYVRGRHSVRTGFQIDTSSWHSTLNSNYLGTYIFTSLAAFQAGTPSNFTRRVGDPTVDFSMLNAAFYVQDDFRVRRNLTISPGLRYERQAHLHDWTGLGPRVGVTWAPAKSGRTALRASAGIFYDWLTRRRSSR